MDDLTNGSKGEREKARLEKRANRQARRETRLERAQIERLSIIEFIQFMNHKAMAQDGIRDLGAAELLLLAWASSYMYGNNERGFPGKTEQIIINVKTGTEVREEDVPKGRKAGLYATFHLLDYTYYINQHFCLFTDDYEVNKKRLRSTLKRLQDRGAIQIYTKSRHRGKKHTFIMINKKWRAYFYPWDSKKKSKSGKS